MTRGRTGSSVTRTSRSCSSGLGALTQGGGKVELVENTVILADIPALITFLLEQRELDPENHTLQLGLDGGQSILKICLLVREAVGEELGKF